MKKRSPFCNHPVFSVYRYFNLLSVPQPINKPRLAWTVSKLVNIIHTDNRYGYMKSTNADPLWTLPEEAPRIGENVFIKVQKPTALFWQYQRGLPGVRLNRRASLMSGSKRLRSKDPTLPANFSTFCLHVWSAPLFPNAGPRFVVHKEYPSVAQHIGSTFAAFAYVPQTNASATSIL